MKLVALFGELFSAKAIPRLLDGLNGHDRSIAKASALALGNIGQKDTIPVLIKTMKSGSPDLRAPAAKAWHRRGCMATSPSSIPCLKP